ncbi:MAG: terminase small subunit [Candidatus Sedimenticola sp. (ex Thyasira tokunagai)]
MNLTPRQSRFIDEYLIDLNGTQAALRAGYSHTGARQEGSRLLAKADIRAVIQKKCRETEVRLQVERDQVLKGLVEAYQEAKALAQPMAMVAAMRELGKLMGYYDKVPEKRVLPDDQRELKRCYQEMTETELLVIVEGE